jgi:MerR family transcriptional regulator, heat shock protein HspR
VVDLAQRDPHEPVYMISIAAQLTGLHPQTIRLYEREGLVSPGRVSNKNRLYSEADIERLMMIRRFTQELGVNLAGVSIILELRSKIEQLQWDMEQLRRRMEAEGRIR